MKKFLLILSVFLVSSAFAAPNNPSNPPRYFSNNAAVPNYNNNGTNWNMPNMNWGNNNGYGSGSGFNMPNMNWGNNNGYGSGAGFNMPNMNWGNNNGYGSGSGFNMPNMNWGNNNGYGNGSNWNMPNMNWGNNNRNRYNNGSNWNNQQRPWNFGSGNNYNNRFAPGIQQRAPMMPIAPRFAPQRLPNPNVNQPPQKMIQQETQSQNVESNLVYPTPTSQTENVGSKIPAPNEVKGVILAPDNKTTPTQEAPK